jgi:hypothetical protein
LVVGQNLASGTDRVSSVHKFSTANGNFDSTPVSTFIVNVTSEIAVFPFGNRIYMSVANLYDNAASRVSSQLFAWVPAVESFVLVSSVASPLNPSHWSSFEVSGVTYLGLSSTTLTNVYRLNWV